jgi:hypothetical protein
MVGCTLHFVHGMVEAKIPLSRQAKSREIGPKRIENEDVRTWQNLRRGSGGRR